MRIEIGLLAIRDDLKAWKSARVPPHRIELRSGYTSTELLIPLEIGIQKGIPLYTVDHKQHYQDAHRDYSA